MTTTSLAEQVDPLHYTDQALRTSAAHLLEELGETRTVSAALLLARLIGTHVMALQELQSLALCRADALCGPEEQS